MIREKDMAEFRPQVRYQDGNQINLNTIENALGDWGKGHGVEMSFGRDQVKFGGLIGGVTTEGLILYHPNHKRDYFNFVITIGRQGNYAFVSVYGTGTSKQTGKQANAEMAKGGMKDAFWNASIDGLIKGVVGGVLSLGNSKKKLQDEQNWYAMVSDAFDEVIC